MDNRTWLAEHYPEVSPLDFYRELFPQGELDKRDAFTPGKYCGMAVQVTKERKAKRYSITDELDNLPELLSSDDFTVISPLSYAGKSQKAENQRFCYALAIDLDGLREGGEGHACGIDRLLGQTVEVPYQGEMISLLPRPTFIAASSANNAHLYYLLDKPIPLWKSNKESLAKYKTNLTERLWNQRVTKEYDRVQQEPIGQSMRAVGSISKDGKSRVRVFRTGDKVSVEYLNRYPFVSEENQIRVWDSPQKQDKPKMAGRKATTVKPAFYEWYKRQLPTYAVAGKRYFCLMVLAIVGRKCGIPQEQIEQDALGLVPMLDDRSVSEDNRFTPEDALKAITAYDVPHFMFMKRETLVRLSGVPMKANKRNGRKKDIHVKILNGTNQVKRSLGEEFATGAPIKKDAVINYITDHPNENISQIARGCGVSRPTVYKWLRALQEKGNLETRNQGKGNR